jgi:hypothetical protein
MASYAGFSLITNDGTQDRMLTASEIERPLFDMRAIDIFKLGTWQVEQRLLHHHLAATRLPNVLEDIIIAYAGSTHADALAIISRRLPRSFIMKISHTNDRHARSAMDKLLAEIAKLVDYPYAKKFMRATVSQRSRASDMEDCIKLARRVVDYDDWPNESAHPRVADIFYAILMLTWSDDQKIDIGGR